MKQKLPVLMLAAALSLGLTACGGEPSSTAGTDKPYVVGICQLTPHPALDEATRGFQDALEEALPGQVQFDVQNAANDPATCSTIANSFVSKDVDLILGNATPALQAAAAATGDIPVLGTAVTEYGVALNLGSFDGTVGGNISGTSDLAPLDEQAAALDPKTAARVLELSDRIVEENRLTTLMVTHNMRDAIAHGNRLIMMYNGRVVIDVSGEEKKKLTVPQLLELFNQASGSDEADDKLLLS